MFLYPMRRQTRLASPHFSLPRSSSAEKRSRTRVQGRERGLTGRSGQAIFTTENPLFFPIRSADPIFRRSHFRLAVFLPTLVQFMTTSRLPPLIDHPFGLQPRDARLSRAFDSRPFRAGPISRRSLVVPLHPRGFAAFYRAPSFTVSKTSLGVCMGVPGVKGERFRSGKEG